MTATAPTSTRRLFDPALVSGKIYSNGWVDGAEVVVNWGRPLARQTVAGGASAELASGLVAVEAIGAVVDTPRRRQG